MFSSYFSIVEAFTTHHIVLNRKVWTIQEGMKYVTNYHNNKVKQCSRRCPSSTCLGLSYMRFDFTIFAKYTPNLQPQLGLLLPIRNASHGIMEHQDHFPPFTRLHTVPWQDKCVFIYQPTISVPKKNIDTSMMHLNIHSFRKNSFRFTWLSIWMALTKNPASTRRRPRSPGN